MGISQIDIILLHQIIDKQTERIKELEEQLEKFVPMGEMLVEITSKLSRYEELERAAERWRAFLTDEQIKFGVQAVRDIDTALAALKEK